MRPRAVIVGAGSAGSVLAARLADRYDVVVIEAGRGVQPLDPRRGLAESGTHPTWSLPAQLTATRTWKATPGRAVGGSSVVNGGYFEAPDRADLELWRAAGGAAWEPERVLSHVAEIAATLEVSPSPQSHPIAQAFAAAAADLGCAGGLLPLHTTFADGLPRNVADVYLAASSSPVVVRSDCRALRIVIEDGRATGLEVADGTGVREVIPADEVLLCAGGFGTARLLLASGIGPADQLRAMGLDPVADLPGVGAAFSDHPTVWVEWMPTAELSDHDSAAEVARGAFPLALQLGADGGAGDDLEILACILPPEIAVTGPTGSTTYGVIVGLQRPAARGTVAVASAHPLAPARIDYRYLAEPADRAALRHGVRRAAELLSARAFAGLVAKLVDLDDAVLADDGRLDEWIADRLGSAAHTCGTAPMGADADPLAVVDGAGRIRGIDGLRVADTSLLPVVPVRGPAAAAMAVGAIIADQMA